MGSNRYNSNKFKEVLHYIVHNCCNLENFGKTVLYKLLYFSDFDNYELYEHSITGETYNKLQHGPAPTHFDLAASELVDEHKLRKINTEFKGKQQQKYLSLKKPQLHHLTGNDMQIIDLVINKLSSMTATQISGYSHGDMPWKSAKIGEELDYEMVFYRSDIFTVREYNNDDV